MSTFKTLDLVYIALFAALMALCSWISIPATIPFTLQTFGVFVTLGLLGGRRGTLAIVLYILLGLVGLPVFSGFHGGIGFLFGATGGYILGFLFSALIYWFIISRLGTKTWTITLAMTIGLILCYAFGTGWFMTVYLQSKGIIALSTVLGWCVIPFVLPDICKLILALIVVKRVSIYIKP